MKILLLFCTLLSVSTVIQAKPSKHDKKLDNLLEQGWEYSMSRSPQTASYYGGKGNTNWI